MKTYDRPNSWKRWARLALQLLLDAAIVNLSVLIAMQLRFDLRIPDSQIMRLGHLWPFMTGICLASFAAARLYSNLWKYAGMDEVLRIFLGSLFGMAATYLFSLAMHAVLPGPNMILLSRMAYLLGFVVLFLLMTFERFMPRIVNRFGVRQRAVKVGERKRVLVVGAGWAGSTLLREMQARGFREGMPVAVVDDDPAKADNRILGVPVLFGTQNIPDYAEQLNIDTIIVAIPSASKAQLKAILEICASTHCKLKMLPHLRDVTEGMPVGEVRDVNLSDLLFRDEVKLDEASIQSYITGKVVLVTGGGGSIGSELCAQIAQYHPSRLLVFDIFENNAYELYYRLMREHGQWLDMEILIGSIRDEKRLDDIFSAYRPQVVFHAAAHKHVPLMETSPAEAVKNNVFGTLNAARVADKYGVERFVSISTDKAVNPTSVMGATKRATEMVIQYMSHRSKTVFMAVRFGNVLGSSGSVIPLFRKQIAAGGPVTVTHPDITRYFMTIPEAAQLVLQAGAYGESGTLFMLDMGTPVKIVDLARNLIRLSGYTPDEDIKITYCGLRPGEKLHEELVMAEEESDLRKTQNEKIRIVHLCQQNDAAFEKSLDALRDAADNDPEHVREALKALVPTYQYDSTKA